MKSKYFLAVLLISGQQLWAQLPEDAIRMSWNIPSGTARNQAIGGAMGSLGGEITSLYVNPAGLGMYKTSELVLTPGISLLKSKSTFRETDAASDRMSRFNLGTSGFVFGWSDPYSKWTSKAFSIGINRTANFNNTIYYKGLNDYSSFSEPLANEFFDYYAQRKDNSPGISNEQIIDDALDDPGISILTKMGLYTYLIDVDTTNGQNTVISRAETPGIVNQENRITTKGGITEIALGYAANMNDKIYIGGSIGIPIVNYQRTTNYRETDVSGNTDNDFTYTAYTENFTSKGAGINARLGIIMKPADYFRLGLSVQSPTLYGLKEQSSYTMATDVENLFGAGQGLDSVTSSVFGADPEFKYDLVSPWKFLVSGSYVIREISDVTMQRGFITADIEYVTHGSSRFSSADEYQDDSEYFKGVNEATKSLYKGSFNFRVGGELKFNTIMGRLGFAYYGNPYDDEALKAHKMNVSGGIGYRNRGMFIDLTYIQSMNKGVNFPYRLDAPRLNTFATIRDNSSNILLTLGLKL